MAAASWVSATVYAAAKLSLADHLASGARSAVELAGPTATHAPSLHRLMRTLAGLGILTERDGQRFALTSLGEALRTGAPGSARATLLAFCQPAFWHSWEEMVYSLKTGKTGFEKACGMPLFDYLAQHPDGRLLIVETVLPTGDTPHQGKVQDMVMLVVPGGQERTEADYQPVVPRRHRPKP